MGIQFDALAFERGTVAPSRTVKDTDWTEEVTARFIGHFNAGFSLATIAEKLNAEFGTEFTRNAAVGKRHRLGLTRAAKPGSGAKMPRKPKEPRPAKHRPVVKVVANGGGGFRLHTSRASADVVKLRCLEIECITPFADVTGCWYPAAGDGPFLFCNGKRQDGSSFCTPHHALCWRPATTPDRPPRKYFGTDFAGRAA